MRLLRVELSRLFHRRAVLILMVLGILTIGCIATGILYANRPVSEAEIARAQEQVDRDNENPYTQRHLARCIEQSGDTVRCEQRWLIDLDDGYLYRDQLNPAQFKPWLIPITGLTAAVALLIGATFIGGDIASGSVGTQLLFQPGRLKVWSAKVGALAIGTGAFAAAAIGGSLGVIWLFAHIWDRPIRDGLLADYSAAVGRGIGFAAASALVGFALALISKHTAAALGALAVYGIAAETLLRIVWAGSEQWLLSNHIAAFVGGPLERRVFGDCSGFDGNCEPRVFSFTLTSSSLYLGAGLAAILGLSWWVFDRRDVP